MHFSQELDPILKPFTLMKYQTQKALKNKTK